MFSVVPPAQGLAYAEQNMREVSGSRRYLESHHQAFHSTAGEQPNGSLET
jgi:hypothetical protein